MISLDTNILIYVTDEGAPAKQAVARQLLDLFDDRPGVVGLQVVGEYQNVLRRKLRYPPWSAAQAARNVLHVFDTFEYNSVDVEDALTLMATGRLSYWDALLVVSARRAGVTSLFSEDMQDGSRFGDIEIVNPFSEGGLSPRAAKLLGLQA